MYFEEIDGERQLDFVRKFDYIRSMVDVVRCTYGKN